MKKRRSYIFLITFIIPLVTIAQLEKDSTILFLESKSAIASNSYLPFWIINNQDGRFSDRKMDAWVEIGFEERRSLDSNFFINYQLETVFKTPIEQSFFKQYNASINWKKIQFIGGRFYNYDDGLASEMRTGSIIQSRNAVPLPRIGFSINEYIEVPFTKGWLSFRGNIYHGWFESERALSNAWLHEKSGYLKLGKKDGLSLSWGLVHLAQWGGTDDLGTTWTRGFSDDYLRIFTGAGSANDENLSSDIRLEGSNRQGNHLGIWDIKLQYSSKNNRYELYYNRIWEDQWSLNKIFNKDALWGLAWRRKEDKPHLLSAIVIEFIHTLLQRGPGIPDSVPGQSNYGYDYGGRDDYYNNWLYRSGWTYKNRVIGNPLFITDNRAKQYFGNINNYGVKIVNNRFWAIHFGFESKPNENWIISSRFTYSRNYGTYAGLNGGRFKWGSKEENFDNANYPFIEPLNQLNMIVELEYSPSFIPKMRINFGLAADIGEMTENYGSYLGLNYNF